MVKRSALFVAFSVGGIAADAHAQVDNTGVLDKALDQYRSAAESWQNAAQGAATTLFWSLATISLAWTMGQLVLRRAELGEFFAELIRYLLFTGFWAWMLDNGPAHAELIIDSMVELASSASAQNRLSPSGVVDVGFHILDRTLTQSTLSSPLISTVGIAVALGILVVLALAAVNMLVSLIACWIVAYGGLIILGFGGSRWTSDMAINYYRMVLSLGLQVLAMVLLVGMGESFLRRYFDTLEQSVSLHELAVLLVVSLVLLVTINRIPALLGTLANGSSPHYALGGGAGVAAAISALSAATGLAALSYGTTKTAAAGTQSLAGSTASLVKAIAAASRGDASSPTSTPADDFQSGDKDTDTTAEGGGGSVFPAAKSASHSVPAPATNASSPEVSAFLGVDDGAAADQAPNQSSLRTAEPAGKTAPEDPALGPSIGPRHAAAAESDSGESRSGPSEPRVGSDAPRAKKDAPRTGPTAPAAASPPEASLLAPNESTPSTRKPPEALKKIAPSDTRMSLASFEHFDAGHRQSAPGAATAAFPLNANSPAGTFAPAPRAAAIPTTAASSLASSSAATPIAQASPAPTTAIAAASASAAQIQDAPFSTAPAGARRKEPPSSPSTSVEPSRRTELSAAYGQQTSVDIEAEVAAFLDKD